MSTFIHDLPEELLVDIFKFHICSSVIRCPLRRTTLALVCKRWHQICLHTSSLWATIHHQDHGLPTTLALQHSRAHPLEVFFRFSSTPSASQELAVESFKETCEHIHRWQDVRLHFPTDDDELLLHLITPAPLLEVILLSVRDSIRSQSPADLFAGEAGRLRSVSLYGLAVPWNSKMLSDLQVLKLCDIKTPQSPSLPELITIITACPRLTTLSLKAIRFSASNPLPQPPFVHLPQLQNLELRSLAPSSCGSILRLVQSPPLQDFYLEIDLDFDDSSPSAITPYIIQHLSPTSYQALDLSYSAYTFQISAGCHHIIITGAPTAFGILQTFAEGLAPKCPDAETSLFLRGVTDVNVGDVLAVADKFCVTSSVISEPDEGQRVLQALAKPVETSGATRWLFPKLRTLAVYDERLDILRDFVEARYREALEAEVEQGEERPVVERPAALDMLCVSGSEHNAVGSNRLRIESIVGSDRLFRY